MKNILVAINFEEKEANVLIGKAVEIAEKFNSKVWIVHVAAPNPDFVGYKVGPQHVRDFRAEELRQEHNEIIKYKDFLHAKNIDADGFLVQGITSEMILKESEKLNIDLVILGHHKHNLLYKIFVGGSIDDSVIEDSKIPVLIVPLG